MGRGIDYGMGVTNIDLAMGIRYGVIHQGEVLQTWADCSEPYYGPPTCPDCGEELVDSEGVIAQYGSYCSTCKNHPDEDSRYPDEPLSFTYYADGYACSQGGDDCDIFIMRSPYYTRAAYCSPCAPGACYLTSPTDEGDKAYCFGHDWFEGGKAPYPVYKVSDNTLVEVG